MVNCGCWHKNRRKPTERHGKPMWDTQNCTESSYLMLSSHTSLFRQCTTLLAKEIPVETRRQSIKHHFGTKFPFRLAWWSSILVSMIFLKHISTNKISVDFEAHHSHRILGSRYHQVQVDSCSPIEWPLEISRNWQPYKLVRWVEESRRLVL